MAFKVLKLNEIANGMTEPKRTLRLKGQEYKKKKKKSKQVILKRSTENQESVAP